MGTLKAVHLPFCYYPDPVGGTEIYVEALVRQLEGKNVEAVIAAPGEKPQTYTHDGIRVRRFVVSNKISDIRDLYGEGDACAAEKFATLLDEERPDVVHVHAFTRGVSLRLVREAKRRGLPVVFTYHTPTVSCQRGTLLRWGQELCNGVLDVSTCTRCTLHGLGRSRMQSVLLEKLPLAGRLARAAGLSGGVWTALRMSELIRLRQASYSTLMSEVDRIVALCDWVKELLLCNGVPGEKIVMSRHGLTQGLLNNDEPRDHLRPVAQWRERGPKIKVAFLGRIDRTKGPDIVLRALRLIPEASIELHLYGVTQDTAADAYSQRLRALAADDSRVVFKPPVASGHVIPLLKNYDLLVVPSLGLETGPLVVLEAFAAGIPVLGSNLGGIAELVEHGVDGLLVDAASVEAWSQALYNCCSDNSLLPSLRANVRSPRGMDLVAQEMLSLYENLTLGKNTPEVSRNPS